MKEHDVVEVTRAIAGHATGAVGTIVGGSDRSFLVEFSDDDGRTLALDDIPAEALRLSHDRSAA